MRSDWPVLALSCFVVVAGCAHAGDANTSFAQRVSVYRGLIATIPACDPAATTSTDRSGRVTVGGKLNLSVGICEEIGDTVYRGSAAGTRHSSADQTADANARCRPCYPYRRNWTLALPGPGVDEIDLLFAAILRPPTGPTDCDGRAFVTAMGDDRRVMVTGRFATPTPLPKRTPPSPSTAASEAMEMHPRRFLQVDRMCRVTNPPAL